MLHFQFCKYKIITSVASKVFLWQVIWQIQRSCPGRAGDRGGGGGIVLPQSWPGGGGYPSLGWGWEASPGWGTPLPQMEPGTREWGSLSPLPEGTWDQRLGYPRLVNTETMMGRTENIHQLLFSLRCLVKCFEFHTVTGA